MVLTLLGLACYRLTLIHTGHFYWADERCYLPASDFVDALSHGEFRQAARHLFEANGKVPPARPGFVLLSTLPVLLQRWVGRVLDIGPASPAFYHAVSVFNVLVSLGVTLCVYALGRLWTGRSHYGLLAALAYSLLCNANVWIRHLVPYPESLLLFLWSLWLMASGIARGPGSRRRMLVCGTISGFGYACYPGHYAALLINGVVALFSTSKGDKKSAIVIQSANRHQSAIGNRQSAIRGGLSQASPFLVGTVFVLGGFELLSRWVGRSYLGDLAALSGSVSMGDPNEGFVFLWRYLWNVEGALGVTLLVLAMGIGWHWQLVSRCLWSRSPDAGEQVAGTIPAKSNSVTDLRRSVVGIAIPTAANVPRTAAVVMLAAAACYGFHASMGVFAGRMVFYGRVLMVFLPLLALGAVLSISLLRGLRARQAASVGLLAVAAWSFTHFAHDYSKVVYPAEFLQQTMDGLERGVTYPPNALWGVVDGTSRNTVEERDTDLVTVNDTLPDGSKDYVHLTSHDEARQGSARFIGVNLKFLGYVAERIDRFEPTGEYVLIASAPHPETLPFAGFEGRRPWERRRLAERNYLVRLYSRKEHRDP